MPDFIYSAHHIVLEMYYKMFLPISFQVWPIFRLPSWHICLIIVDFVISTPFGDTFWPFLRPFADFGAKLIKFDIYRVLEMYYKVFVPISF